ncbi:MAG: hypothetical protein O3A95_05850 [Planctomycetota bacterium]|nr:hypothetical protein [Planctomycetota bacterium]MDA1113811.1 hypothetical protein [Planctomycetota bacterium]
MSLPALALWDVEPRSDDYAGLEKSPWLAAWMEEVTWEYAMAISVATRGKLP